MTDLAAALRAAIDAAKDDLSPKDSGYSCQLAVCRGKIRTRYLPDEDGDVQPYGYCTSCGLPVS